MVKKHPVGSKLVGTYLGFNYLPKPLVCKVVGYSIYTNSILVYNPSIDGHSGNGVCSIDGKTEIPDGDLYRNYGRHCWYIESENLTGG